MLDRSLANGILTLRMARPPANALDTGLITALADAITGAKAQGAEALILTGREGMFSGGLDVPHLLSLDAGALKRAVEAYFSLCQALAESEIPTVAAISGHSPAGGAVLAIHMDYRVMAEGKFVIGLNETQVGLGLPPALAQALSYVIGPRQTERLVVPGLLISGEEALRIGLVDALVAQELLLKHAETWCQTLLSVPRQTMLHNRRLARAPLIAAAKTFDSATLDAFLGAWSSTETQAALKALAKKLGK